MAQMFRNAVLTDAGAELLTKAQEGTAQIMFTTMKIGNGEYTEEEKEIAERKKMKRLKSEKNSYAFSEKTQYTSNSLKLQAIFTNFDGDGESIVQTGYYINEIGLFAKNKMDEDGEEILYSVAVVDAERGDYMPPYSGSNPVAITQEYYVTVDASENVTINLTGAYAGAESFQRLKEDFEGFKKMYTVSEMEEITSQINADDEIIVGTGREVKKTKTANLADSIMNVFAKNGGAGLHNSIFRGKNLGTVLTEEQKEQITAGTFDDMWIGDYWIINGIVWRIAHLDYWLRCGDVECTRHHVVIVPDENLDSKRMNDTNTTDGGYLGCKMRTEYMEEAREKVRAAFGGNLITVRRLFTNAVVNGKPTNGAWADSTIDLMDECMTFGSRIFASANDGTTVPYNYTTDYKQFALFALAPQFICNRAWYWLLNVVSAAWFAYVIYNGNASYDYASNVGGVRPAFAIG